MNKSENINELAQALLAVQKGMPKAKKTADNPFFKSKYAPLDEVMPLALDTLSKHDIAVSQLVTHIDNQSALETTLMHSSGQFISAVQPLVLDKNNPQGQGSAITYARRYAIMSAIGMVADEDDDGNKSSPQQPKQSAQGYPASDKQKALIAKKLGENGVMGKDDIHAFLLEQWGVKDPANLTSKEASQIIEDLLNE